METTRLRITPGYYNESLEMFQRMGNYVASFDGAALLRIHEWHVTDTRPEVSLQLVFHDALTRARVLDRMRADGVRSPFMMALRSPRPPVEVVRRTWLETLQLDSAVPLSSAVTAYSMFLPEPGRELEARSVCVASEDRHRTFGVEATLWVARQAGTFLGWHVMETGFDSFEDMTAYQELSGATLPLASPLDTAVTTGLMRRIGWSVATTIHV